MEHVRVGFVSIPREEAKELATALVEKRLAACVNIVPKIESVYWWDDKVGFDEESLMIIKTTQIKVEELIEYVKDNHPYELPEVIFLKLTEGLPDYLNYVIDETGKKE